MRVGIARHLGLAVAVTASAGYEVVDRRRIELIEPGVPAASVEHEVGCLGDDAAVRMVAAVRASGVGAAGGIGVTGPACCRAVRAGRLGVAASVAVAFPGDVDWDQGRQAEHAAAVTLLRP